MTVMRHMKLKYFEVPSCLDIDTYTISCTGLEYVLAYVAGPLQCRVKPASLQSTQ